MLSTIHRFRFSVFVCSLAILWSCNGCKGSNNGGSGDSCTTRADCGSGERCNADGQCTTESDSCEFASDCGVDEYCAAGTCDLAACGSDDECVEGAICEDEACRAGCREDGDCPEGQSCTDTNVCAQEGCTTNSCPDFQACNEDLSPPACEYTGDCSDDVHCAGYAAQVDDGEEYICSTAEGKCVVRPPCGDDGDCAIGDICEPRQSDGRKVCRSGCRDNDGCRSGQICDPARLVCTQGCDTVDDCPADDNEYACIDLVCIPVCETRNDCLAGQVCKGSPRTCQACSQNADCPATDFCDFTQGVTEEEMNNPLLGLCAPLPPTCPDDGYGDNHDQNSPYVIATLPFETDAATAPLFCRENAGGEWFQFDAAAGDVIEVELTYDSSLGNLDLGLRREQGDELVASAQSPAIDGGTELIRFGVDLGGTFLVQVRGTITETNANYGLRINVEPPGACTADSLEPNNTEMTAAAITAMQDYPDLEVCGMDPDFYSLDVAENQVVRVTAEAPVNLGNIDLILRDSTGTQVAAAQTRNDVEEIEIALDDAGTYTVEVRVVSGVGNVEYDLMWSQRDNNCADPFEVNDTCPAADLAAGSHTGLNVCNDSDWYQFDLLPLQTVTVTATYDRAVSAGDLDITLHGPNECATLVADGTETTMGMTTVVTEELSYQAPQGGEFNLQVFLFSGIQAQYDLDVVIDDGPPCMDDPLEPNDDSATAHMISRAAAAAGTDNVLTGLKMCDTDEDWYQIDLQDGDEIQFDVKFTSGLGDLDAELIGPGNVVVDAGSSMTDDESVTYTVGAGEGGTYYLKVKAKVAARNDYWVLTYLNGTGPVDPVCPDDLENNDTQMEAAAVTPGAYGLLVCGMPSDDDWFSTPVAAGETITVDLSFTHSVGNIDLFLFDDLGSTTAVAQSRTTMDAESVSYTSSRDQTMTWRVESVSNVAAQPYDMNLAVAAAPACPTDAFTGNSTSGGAAQLTAPNLYSRLQMCDGADEWYAFDLTAGRASEVFINFDGSKADLDLFVYAAGDLTSPIEMATSTSSDESVTFTPSTTGTYYAKVTGKANARLSYDLMLFTDTDGDGTAEGPEDRVCPDAFEDNDARTSAKQVPVGSYDDLLICPADQDYLQVFVPAGATLTATLNFDNDLGNIDLRILSAAGAVLGSSATTNDTETASVTNMGLGTNYIVHVAPSGAAFTNYYDLEIELSFADVCMDDTQAGGSKATAGNLATGAYELVMCEGEEDWFNLGSITAVDARLEFKNQLGDIDVELHDAGGVVVAETGTENTEELVVSGLSGQHWLRVFPKNGAFVRNSYDLWLSLNNMTPSAPHCPDVYERNDDILSAESITVPATPQYPALNACGADQDWFLTPSLSAIAHEVAVFYDHGTGSDVSISIWDDDDDPSVDPPEFEIDTAADDAIGSWTPSAASKYFVLVENEAASATSTPYELLIGRSTVYTTTCPEDTHEPNENVIAAKQVAYPTDLALGSCGGSDDYFRFTAPSSGPITVTVLFDASKLNLGLQVFNRSAGGASVGLADANMGNRETVTFDAVAGDEYAVGVLRAEQKNGPYFLRIE